MHRIFLMILVLGLLVPACTDPVAPPAPTPVAPTITETFNDTLLQLGTNTHVFNVQQVGGLKVTISDITPEASVTFGIGTQSLVGCTLVTQLKRDPGGASQLSGTATTTGQFCVMVFDPLPGALVEPVIYTVTVLHS
jgi:hypothetical protein